MAGLKRNPLVGSKLNQLQNRARIIVWLHWLLLREAMKRAEAPDEVGGINIYNLAGGETPLQNCLRNEVVFAVKRWHQAILYSSFHPF